MEQFHIMKTYGDILYRCGDKRREDDIVRQWVIALKHGQPLASSTAAIGWPDMFSVIDPLAYIYLKRAEKALRETKRAGKAGSMATTKVRTKFDTATQHLDLIKGLKQKTDIWMNTDVTCCSVRYYKIAQKPQEASSTVSKVVAVLIGILSDNDESNDWFAYLQLGRIMEALQDKKNSNEAWKRVEKMTPFTANVSPWFLCDECKQSIHLPEGLYVCMESFQLRFFHSGCCGDLEKDKSQTRSIGLHKIAVILPNANGTGGTINAKQKEENKMSLSLWKAKIQAKHILPEDHVDMSSTCSTPVVPAWPEIPTPISPVDKCTRPSFQRRLKSDTE